ARAAVDCADPGRGRTRRPGLSGRGLAARLRPRRACALHGIRPADLRDRAQSRSSAGMTISVVIATYNRATLLAECLQYLSRQRFCPGDEVIVVDNGSTDDTPRVIAE